MSIEHLAAAWQAPFADINGLREWASCELNLPALRLALIHMANYAWEDSGEVITCVDRFHLAEFIFIDKDDLDYLIFEPLMKLGYLDTTFRVIDEDLYDSYDLEYFELKLNYDFGACNKPCTPNV